MHIYPCSKDIENNLVQTNKINVDISSTNRVHELFVQLLIIITQLQCHVSMPLPRLHWTRCSILYFFVVTQVCSARCYMKKCGGGGGRGEGGGRGVGVEGGGGGGSGVEVVECTHRLGQIT